MRFSVIGTPISPPLDPLKSRKTHKRSKNVESESAWSAYSAAFCVCLLVCTTAGTASPRPTPRETCPSMMKNVLTISLCLLASAACSTRSGMSASTDSRKIEYDVHEGSWMSVDVAPNGKTLVFDLIGHIYELPIAGGTA